MDYISRCPLLLCAVYLFMISRFSVKCSLQQCAVLMRRGDTSTNYKGPAVRKGAQGPSVLHMSSSSVVALFVNCKNLPFQTKPKSLRNLESVFQFSIKIFSWSAPAGPEPALSCHGCMYSHQTIPLMSPHGWCDLLLVRVVLYTVVFPAKVSAISVLDGY